MFWKVQSMVQEENLLTDGMESLGQIVSVAKGPIYPTRAPK
jgi:hypothetical protein